MSLNDDKCKITNRAGKLVGVVPKADNKLYKVDHTEVASAAIESVPLFTLHKRLGHIAPNTIRSLIASGAITGVSLLDDPTTFTCDSCEYAKSIRKPIQKEREAPLAKAFGDEIHMDLWGPSPVQSLGGRKYYITFTDDHTRYSRLQLLRTKDEALNAYKAFATCVMIPETRTLKPAVT